MLSNSTGFILNLFGEELQIRGGISYIPSVWLETTEQNNTVRGRIKKKRLQKENILRLGEYHMRKTKKTGIFHQRSH